MRVWVVVEVVGAIFHGEDVGASAGDGFLVEGDGAVEGAFGDVAPSADKVVNYFDFDDSHVVTIFVRHRSTGHRCRLCSRLEKECWWLVYACLCCCQATTTIQLNIQLYNSIFNHKQ